jgi:hypothetical protein
VKEAIQSEELERKAFLLGLKFKQSGLDQEMIYVRLEKDGIPEDLALKVVRELAKGELKKERDTANEKVNVALVIIAVALLLAITSALLIPGKIVLPIGIIGGGIISALISNKK